MTSVFEIIVTSFRILLVCDVIKYFNSVLWKERDSK